MLHAQGLQKFLWGEAPNTIVYVQNRWPHQALDSKIPEEVFIGKKLDVSHFIIFGSPVYFHAQKEKRSKLDAARKKGTFVGYNETSKAYRIYVPSQREVKISHDVTFDEDVAPRILGTLPFQRRTKKKIHESGENHRMSQFSMLKDQWIPLVYLPMSPPPQEGYPHGLGTLSKMRRDIFHQGGNFMKVRSQIGTKST